ncbi:MAG: type II toxin-antitoxin system VapC family toxin [Acidobacteria bacterium]|nr:type II toxin-antitoxin system VapC family toxin [Acidobacteriota bacterium]
MQVFIDTSYFFARLVARDQWHHKAKKAVSRHLAAVTSSLVVNETISLLQAKGMFSAALTFLRGIRDSPDVRIIHVDPVLQAEAWDLFGRWGASGANPVDCASFAIMRSLGIKKAFTFDAHFRTAGFEILR